MEDEMSFRFGEGQAIFTGEVLVLGGVIFRLFHDNLRRLSIEDAKKNCSNIFQWILYKWKGMSTALFCLSIVASLGPTKPAVPVNKNVVLVMFNGWASPCCELFVGAGPNLFCFVVIAKN